jgi:hypothetical protein
MTRDEALVMLRQVSHALLEAIDESDPDFGMPLGPAYMACNARGMSLNVFQQIIAGLVGAGLIEVSNNCARRKRG